MASAARKDDGGFPAPGIRPTRGDAGECRAIGLDVGGTKIAGGIVSFPSGRLLTKHVIPTEAKRGGAAVLADCVELARDLHGRVGTGAGELLGVGIAVPELVDPEGVVRSEYSIAWDGLVLAPHFTPFGAVAVEMDNTTGALAEALFGAGRDFEIFLYVTAGTGLGCSLVQDRVPYRGAHGAAGVFANAPLTAICSRCGAVVRPVLDEIASGPALVNRYNGLSGGGRAESGQDVVVAAAAGDAVAADVLRAGGEALGVAVGLLVDVLDPEAVVLGGGLGTAGGLYWEAFVSATRNHIWSPRNRDLPVLQAALGPDTGIVGAAASVWSQSHAPHVGGAQAR